MRLLGWMGVALCGCVGWGESPGGYLEPPAVRSPDNWGPYPVGVVTVQWVDVRGKSLVADVWYPAVHAPEDVASPYDPTVLSLSAVRGAEPERIEAPYPLVAFSHGSYGIRFQSVFLMEFLASHGFVVVSPDHEGNTFLDAQDEAFLEVLVERPGDVQSSVERLLTLSATRGELLEGVVDEGDAAIVGHSFGAFTALVLAGGRWSVEGVGPWCEANADAGLPCRYLQDVPEDLVDGVPSDDPRFQVTVAMAPGIWYGFGEDGEGLEGVARPLVFGSRQDNVLPYEREVIPTYDRLVGERALVSFDRAQHYAPYSNLCEFIPAYSEGCAGAPEWVDPSSAQRVTRSLTLAWVREALRPDTHGGDREAFSSWSWGEDVSVSNDR